MFEESRPKLSVVICFKDWGLERLTGVTQSIFQSNLGDDIEVIISDYGSIDSSGYEDSLSGLGARYFYFETDGVWSRSRALNLGIKEARGKFVVTTDSDMVFTPSTFPTLLKKLEDNPRCSYILQCRDLPEGIEHEQLLSDSADWQAIDAVSKLRPRWGMGGLIAFHRYAYQEIRGLDERFEVYGGEDLDLAKRLVRAGYKRIWIEDPRIKMYHVWHPSSRQLADETPEGRAAIARNTSIHKQDYSIVRNLERWNGRPVDSEPLVTVAISTYNRADYILESVRSVQSQSFKDWELVIVNDGSTDDTKQVLGTIDDPRVRVFNRENAGLAAARNFITSIARGKYIAVHDDDDLMLPTRLEDQLSALKPGINGSFGAWVNFDNDSGELDYNSGKAFSIGSMLFNFGVYLHPTLMVERKVLQAIPYNETMRSGSDFNLAVRMARSGVKLEHSKKIVMLRRLHDRQITNSHGELQKVSGRVSSNMGRALMLGYDKRVVKEARTKEDLVEVIRPSNLWNTLGPYLPDHLVPTRSADVRISIKETDPTLVEWLELFPNDGYAELNSATQKIGIYQFSSLTLQELTMLQARFGSAISVSDLTGDSTERSAFTDDELQGLVGLQQIDDLWEDCVRILEKGVYAVIESRKRTTTENGDEAASTLSVSIVAGNSNEKLDFYQISDIEAIEKLPSTVVVKYSQIAGTNKLTFLQKD